MSDTIISPESNFFILNEIIKLQSTPEDPPINRRSLDIKNNDLRISIQENRSYMKKSLDSYKVSDKNGSKVVYLPKEKIITVDIKYSRMLAIPLWLRIYPVTTSNECQHKSVVSCNEHKKHIFNKHTDNNASNVLNSIIELNDPAAAYEKIALPGGENQITTRVRYFNPETSVHVAFKCYNTCVEGFKRTLPLLKFSIESYNDDKDEYTVLGEEFVQFKVCASPSRDFKSEICHHLQKKRLCLNTIEVPGNQNIPQFRNKRVCVANTNYTMKLLTEKEMQLIEVVRDMMPGDHSAERREVLEMEERMTVMVDGKVDSNNLVKVEKSDTDGIYVLR